jgi:hypothetical protein
MSAMKTSAKLRVSSTKFDNCTESKSEIKISSTLKNVYQFAYFVQNLK